MQSSSWWRRLSASKLAANQSPLLSSQLEMTGYDARLQIRRGAAVFATPMDFLSHINPWEMLGDLTVAMFLILLPNLRIRSDPKRTHCTVELGSSWTFTTGGGFHFPVRASDFGA